MTRDVPERRDAEHDPDSLSEEAARNTLALNPLIGLRGKDLMDSAAILLKAVLTHFGTSLARSANLQTNQELAWRLNQGSFSPHASQPPLDRSARL